jgi:flagellar FliJ protein
MTWRASLIRIANYEVEELQKRLAEIVDRRADAETRLTMLAASAEAEMAHAAGHGDARFPLSGYLAGVKIRKAQINTEIQALLAEEAGARDALTLAFESLKKFEQVAETAKLVEAKEEARRETAAMDEMGLRAASR